MFEIMKGIGQGCVASPRPLVRPESPGSTCRPASYAAPAGSPRASEDQLSDAEDAYARGYDRTPSSSPPSPTPSASTTPMSDDEEAATFTDPKDLPGGDPSV